jgi:hypothetical protein
VAGLGDEVGDTVGDVPGSKDLGLLAVEVGISSPDVGFVVRTGLGVHASRTGDTDAYVPLTS